MGAFRAANGLLVLLLAVGWSCGGGGPAPFLVIAGPGAVSSVELLDAEGAVIWRLEAEPPAPLAELYYGTVPAGFAQSRPRPGEPPRPLLAGEPLTAESTTLQRVIVHHGYAEAGNQFVIGSWETRLLAAPPGAPPADPLLGDPAATP